MDGLLSLLLLFLVVRFIYKKLRKERNLEAKSYHNVEGNNKTYVKKTFMSICEKEFYNKIKDLDIEYMIIPQINLASIISKKSEDKFQNELFRNIDFGIIDKETNEVLLLIELNDKTHESYSRIERDKKVKNICNSAGIKLITFYTKYPNKKDYVLNRIRNEIEQIKNPNIVVANLDNVNKKVK